MPWTVIGSLRGPAGPSGPAGVPVIFTQDIPSAMWIIPHSFGYFPAVTVFDSTGEEVDVEISHAPGVVTVHAEFAFAGRAHMI